MKEADLYAPVKKSFKADGYAVYAEVACNYRGVDMVAEKGDEQIAIELKLSFNDKVVQQARDNKHFFDKSYIAFPVKKPIYFNMPDELAKLRESVQWRYTVCQKMGIGILEVLPSGVIFEVLEAEVLERNKHIRRLDLTHYIEADDDLGGLPYQRGVSEGYHELEGIKRYVTAHPNASWKEIFDNVSNHYSSHTSMAGAMRQWRGFSLAEFKKGLATYKPEPVQESMI